ncbi:UNVERIFIED_CONTAM: hypothetical protein GTU68_013452, partial [Idotea baltica]|nr:hypothetical protein [Idotea baltica]
FKGRTNYEHGTNQRVGVLLLNLGTPNSPTAKDLKPYLKQFLSDKRVIEVFRPLWLLILNGIILRTRPKKSAEAYKSIWTDEGSPLLVISKEQRNQVELKLRERFGDDVTVSLGMRYGTPSVASALKELKEKECSKIVVLPIHCQKTARLVGEQLGLTRDDFIVSFQSLFGKEEWVKPYTSGTLEYLAKNGTTSVDVICPGFIADCVETLEEIEDENREVFMEAGGEKFSYIPSLNARNDAIDFFSDLIIENSVNWLPITKQRQVSYSAYQDYEKVSKAQCPFLKK